MVMEAPPSPQSVGREFVRQYYTLLNKAPTHLHRFYNHQSSFIHGGLDLQNRETSPVIGQKQIHQKIQQLNFRDCHAKITQVDSQATLGNGVVVQVTGELSNAGQPMRRFTQTFVLAAQSPKKYYVHNDIFRYQDEIISDEECDADQRSDVDEDMAQDRNVIGDVQQHLSAQPTAAAGIPQYYNPATGGAQMPPTIPQVPIHHNQQPPPAHVLNPPQVATVNGAIHPDDISVIPDFVSYYEGQVPSHVPPTAQSQTLGGTVSAALQQPPQQQQQPVSTMIQQQQQQQPVVAPIADHQQLPQPAEEVAEDKQFDDWDALIEPQQSQQPQVDNGPEPEQPQEPASNEPKTYANLLKSGNTGGSAMSYGGVAQQTSTQPTSYASARATSPTSMGGGGRPAGGPRADAQQSQAGGAPRPPRQDSMRGSQGGPGGMRGAAGNDDGAFDDRRRSQSSFNDVNQLFLGNVPHTATEEELWEIFSEFGEIMDLRIHSKPPSKVGGQPGGRAPPNYGFITYKLQQHVQTCLSSKSTFTAHLLPKGRQERHATERRREEDEGQAALQRGGNRQSMDGGPRGGGRGDGGMPPRDGRRMGGGGPGGPNRNIGGGAGGPPPNRSNSYQNRNTSGGPPNQRGGSNSYRR
nr:unnamed protein product [Callosobruchus analis]